MTDPGFTEAFRQFTTEVDAAVVRARRAAAEARETSARFRRETRQLAEQAKAAATSARPVTAPSPFRTAGSGRVITPRSDDDEDFSHERIMR